MRKFILSFAFISLAIAQSVAQNNAIKLKPVDGQGFLVLDDNIEVGVDHWLVLIQTRVENSDGSVSFITKQKIELHKTNYLKIIDEYRFDPETYVTIEGMAADGTIIHTGTPEAIGDTPPGFEACKWSCNGLTYAYDLALISNAAQTQTSLKLEDGVDFVDPLSSSSIPFYQYMSSVTYFGPFCSSSDWFTYANSCAVNGVTIAGPFSADVNDQIYSGTGNLIIGPYYAVKKTRGPWSTPSNVQTNPLPYGPEACVSTLSDMIFTMNSAYYAPGDPLLSHYGLPELQCIPALGTTINAPGFDTDCLPQMLNFTIGIDGDIFDLLAAIEDCNTGSSPPFWWEDIDELMIDNLNTDNDDPIVINTDDLFDANGTYNPVAIAMDASLYAITIKRSDGAIIPLVKEVVKPIVSTMTESDFLDVLIYPNPILNEEFDIHLEADAKLKFNYVLYDFDGNEIYRKTFVVQKDHDRSHTIKPKDPIPTGVLINSFEFEDGSVLNFQTIKN